MHVDVGVEETVSLAVLTVDVNVDVDETVSLAVLM